MNYGFDTSAEKTAYIDIVKPFTGMLTDKKEEEITALYERLLCAQELQSRRNTALDSGDIVEASELSKELQNYSYELSNVTVIERIYEQYLYAASDKTVRAILPIKGVGVTENSTANYLFLICACFYSAFDVIIERNSKTELIIRTTTGGGEKTSLAKSISVLTLISGTSIILSCIDFIALCFQLPNEFWQYDISSVEMFSACPVRISILSAFLFVQIMRLVGICFISAASMITSHLSGSYAASVFPFISLPVIADYLSERDSGSYYLPSGLLKGWGYFYGDVKLTDEVYEIVIFHGISFWYTVTLFIFSVTFIIAVIALLRLLNKNRITKKIKPKAMILCAFLSLLMLITGCNSNSRNDTLHKFGGSISVTNAYNHENERYKFNIENIPSEDSGKITNRLNITDKSTGVKEVYPFNPMYERIVIESLFVADDFALIVLNTDEGRELLELSLDDFTAKSLYKTTGIQKYVLGLAFDYGDENTNFDFDGAFSDGNTIYLYNSYRGVAKLGSDKKPHIILSDDISFGLTFDGKAFYYISQDEKLHKFDIKSATNEIIYEGKADGYSVFGDENYIYFKSDKVEKRYSKTSGEVE